MPARTTHRTWSAGWLALGIIVAACGSDAATTTTSAETTVTILSSTVATAAETTTTTTTPATTTTAERVMASADCMVGDWTLDSSAFLDQVFAEAGDLEGATFSHGGGEYLIAMADDGTFVGTRDNWQMRFETADGIFVTTLDGTEEGTWSIEGDSLSISTAVSDVTVSSGIEVDGEIQQLPFSGTQTVRTDAFDGSGTFTCDDDHMTVTFEGITSVLDRS